MTRALSVLFLTAALGVLSASVRAQDGVVPPPNDVPPPNTVVPTPLVPVAPVAPPTPITPTPSMTAVASGHETVCTGDQDEDGDGLADCADADCFSATECRAGGSEERSNDACSDWIDNDADGAVDCEDDECGLDWITVCRGSYSTGGGGGGVGAVDDGIGGSDADLPDVGEGGSVEDLIGTGGDTNGERTDEACADGIDNDADGRTDCADFGCRFDPEVNVCQGSPGIRFSVVGGVGARVTLGFDTNDTYLRNTPEVGFTLLQLRALGSIPFINHSFFLISIRAEDSIRLSFLLFQIPLGDAGHYLQVNSGSGTLTTTLIASAARLPFLDRPFYMTNAFEQGNGAALEAGGPIDSGGVLRFRVFGAAGSGNFTGTVGGARLDTTPEASNFSYTAGAQFQLDLLGHYDRMDLNVPYTPRPLTLALTAGAKYDQRPLEQFVAWQAAAVFRFGVLDLRAETIGRFVFDYGGAINESFTGMASVLLVPRLLVVSAEAGGFFTPLNYDPLQLAALSTGARNDLFLPEEFQWRAAIRWYFFRSVGTLTLVYRENYSPQVVFTTSLRAPIERELRLEARFSF